MKKRLTLLLALVAAGLAAQADHTGSFEYQEPARVDSGGRLAVAEANAEILPTWQPFPERAGTVGAGLGARVTRMDFSGNTLEDRTLYALRMPLQFSTPILTKTRLLIRLSPGISSDLKQVDAHDFRLNGMALAFYPWRPRVSLAAGLIVGDWTGAYGILPAAGLRWQASDNLTLDLFMPRPKMTYKITDLYSVFVSAGPAGGQWNIGKGTEDDPERDLHYKALQASLGGEWRLRPGLALTLAGGGLFNRSLETDGPTGTELENGVDIGDTAFVTLALKMSNPKRPSLF